MASLFRTSPKTPEPVAAPGTPAKPDGKARPKLGQMLVERGIISSQDLAIVLGQQLGVPYVNLNTCHLQPEALKMVSEATARRYNVIPIAVSGNSLQVAMADANDIMVLEALSAQTHMRIEPLIAAAEDIPKAIDRNYKSYREIEKQLSDVAVLEAVPAPRAKADDSLTEAPVVRALDMIVDEAIKTRTSDIHIEPEIDRLRLRYRIDGVLHEVMSLPLSGHAPLISRIKILANMNIADHRPQDGQFSVRVRDKDVDIRVATIATTNGEMAVLRILDKAFAVLNLSEIGFLPDSLKKYQRMLKSPFGMILVSGPTGSGKTTTLYASINGLDCRGRNIITVEDPVEYRLQGINQIQVNPRAGLTFSSGLRAIMRHDPNVILVGEIRDSDTANIAVQAALTGHLVLASIHANDSIGVISRLIDLGAEPFLVSSALIGVAAQRMVRRVCPHCRHSIPAPVESALAYSKAMGEERKEFFYGKGCNSCANTGYLGRVAVFEMLVMSDEIRRLLISRASETQVEQQAATEGMVPMWHDGMLKVQAGITTPCEVVRNVFTIE